MQPECNDGDNDGGGGDSDSYREFITRLLMFRPIANTASVNSKDSSEKYIP